MGMPMTASSPATRNLEDADACLRTACLQPTSSIRAGNGRPAGSQSPPAGARGAGGWLLLGFGLESQMSIKPVVDACPEDVPGRGSATALASAIGTAGTRDAGMLPLMLLLRGDSVAVVCNAGPCIATSVPCGGLAPPSFGCRIGSTGKDTLILDLKPCGPAGHSQTNDTGRYQRCGCAWRPVRCWSYSGLSRGYVWRQPCYHLWPF